MKAILQSARLVWIILLCARGRGAPEPRVALCVWSHFDAGDGGERRWADHLASARSVAEQEVIEQYGASVLIVHLHGMPRHRLLPMSSRSLGRC